MAPVNLLKSKQSWRFYVILGGLLWLFALVLWWQQQIDADVLFAFNAARVANSSFITFSQWLSSYGMAAITSLFVVYRVVSLKFQSLDAPVSIYFYSICSFGLSGILGDMLKIIFARPRPIITYGDQILVFSESLSNAIPSGHATKSAVSYTHLTLPTN